MRFQVGNVGFVSGYQIIQTQNIPAFFEQQLAEMRTQKPRSPGNHRPQV